MHARIRQHTQLGVLAGTDVLFIERMSTRDAVVNATLIGGRIPLPISSSGLVLLAHAGDALVDEVVAAGWPLPTAHTIRDGAELRQRLRRVRADGFAVTDGHIHPESRGIAVPVLGPHGVVYAAMGVVVPNDDTPPARGDRAADCRRRRHHPGARGGLSARWRAPGLPLMTTSRPIARVLRRVGDAVDPSDGDAG